MDKDQWPGRTAMQVVKDRIAILNGVSARYPCDSADLSSPPTSAQLTSKTLGCHQDVLKLYAMSKIDIWTPWAPICEYQTPDACAEARQTEYLRAFHTTQSANPIGGAAYMYAVTNIESCPTKVHFEPISTNCTTPELGDCAYLDQCHRVWSGCRYVHYTRLCPKEQPAVIGVQMLKATKFKTDPGAFDKLSLAAKYDEFGKLMKAQGLWRALGPIVPSVPLGGPSAPLNPQFVNCDIRTFDLKTLGEFAVVMADPSWPIHMSLPYAAIRDDELLNLPAEVLSDQGVIFLWVTTRTMDLGRRCIRKWGYEVAGKVIWVKMNHLNKTIVTGRTGHWFNHTKETCLIGLKGSPPSPFTPLFGQDTDTIVAPMREPSRKPDEIYDMIDRLAGPETRKIELFGRTANLRSGWLTLGNQLPGIRGDFDLAEEDIRAKVGSTLNEDGVLSQPYEQSWQPMPFQMA